ncbi:MAG: hypothetical protein R3D26_19065 [Cyanobacteriota/Melainabacteria group bacterium]
MAGLVHPLSVPNINPISWQAANPIDLVQYYLAVRMFYVRELTQHCCKVDLGIEGSFGRCSLLKYLQKQT